MAEPIHCTLLNLVRTVSRFAESDDEVTATVAYLVNSGKVQLCGNFAGAKIDLWSPPFSTNRKTWQWRRVATIFHRHEPQGI